MKEGYADNVRLSGDELDELKKIVKSSHGAPWIHSSIDGLNASKTASLCGIYSEGSLASFAWLMQRRLAVDGKIYAGLSIGVVTTVASRRHKGHAKSLLEGIERQAKENGIDFLYLAGIGNFYNKYGFKGFAPKSKLIFNKSDLPKGHGTITAVAEEHLPRMANMHDAYANSICSYFSRSSGEWKDLVGPLSSTFLFNQPRIVINSSGQPMAYFCTTPGDPKTIREFIPLIDPDSVIGALAVIADSPDHFKTERLEIFTPARGPVWEAAASRVGADFLCFLRPSASNMVKWISDFREPDGLQTKFILQGDIL